MKFKVDDEVYDNSFKRKGTVLTNEYMVGMNVAMVIVKQEKTGVTYAAKVDQLEKTSGSTFTAVAFNPASGMVLVFGPFNNKADAVRAVPETMFIVRMFRVEKQGSSWVYNEVPDAR